MNVSHGRRSVAKAVPFLILMPFILPQIPFRAQSVTTNLVKECLTGGQPLPQITARVAFVKPTFTLTPYANYNSSFYAFYNKYGTASGYITSDLGWLSTKVTGAWSSPKVNNEEPLYQFLSSAEASRCGLTLGQNLSVVDDVAVNNGGLFTGTARAFDVLILGHEEYVTSAEYFQLKAFVASGGRIVEMSGNTFWGEVTYAAGVETFVVGHGFEFDGTKAWRTSDEPFDADSRNWFGSSFADNTVPVRGAVLSGADPIGGPMAAAFNTSSAFTDYAYPHDEQNYVANFQGTFIIARFYNLANDTLTGGTFIQFPFIPIDSYLHFYGSGTVVCLCVFGEDIILNDSMAQYFLVAGVALGYSPIQSVSVAFTCSPAAAYCFT